MIDPSETAIQIGTALKSSDGQRAANLGREALGAFFSALEAHRKRGQEEPFHPGMQLVWLQTILNLLPRMRILARVPTELKESFTQSLSESLMVNITALSRYH